MKSMVLLQVVISDSLNEALRSHVDKLKETEARKKGLLSRVVVEALMAHLKSKGVEVGSSGAPLLDRSNLS